MLKPFWQSKTIWFNLLTGLVACANELAPVVDQLAMAGWGDDRVAMARSAVMVTTIIGNLILRPMTNAGVTLR